MKKQLLYGLMALGSLLITGLSYSMQEPLRYNYKGTEITLGFGNIENQKFYNKVNSAIVNAANSKLLGGGGVDGAIHYAAGGHAKNQHGVSITGAKCSVCDGIKAKWDKWTSDPLTGDTSSPDLSTGYVLTCGGHNLGKNGVKYIIHAVGPDCRKSDQDEDRKNLLTSVYLKSLQEAAGNRVTHIAFPQISVGIFEYPLEEAVQNVVETIKQYINENPGKIKQIRLVMYNDDIGKKGYKLYQQALKNHGIVIPSKSKKPANNPWNHKNNQSFLNKYGVELFLASCVVGGFALGIALKAYLPMATSVPVLKPSPSDNSILTGAGKFCIAVAKKIASPSYWA